MDPIKQMTQVSVCFRKRFPRSGQRFLSAVLIAVTTAGFPIFCGAQAMEDGIDAVEVIQKGKDDGSILFMDMEPIANHKNLPKDAIYTDINASPDARAKDALERLTFQEKIDLTGGVGSRCLTGVPRLGLRAIHVQNASQGIGVHLEPKSLSKFEKSTSFPCTVMLAATWNEPLAKAYGLALGKECRALYVDGLEGPGINMYRHSEGGRNFEYMGEDPHLTSRIVVNYIQGLQSVGTYAIAKHFICNDADMGRHIVNINVGERALREIYLPPFEAVIKEADCGALMNGNNFVNGWPGAANRPLVQDYLRDELGFKGIIMSDFSNSMFWPKRRDLILTSGQSMMMPRNNLFAAFLAEEVKNNPYKKAQLEKELDQMVYYNLYTHFKFGVYDRHSVNKAYADCFEGHKAIARRVAEQGITLLKNDENLLPIDPHAGKRILLCGIKKHMEQTSGKGSGGVYGYDVTNLPDGMKKMYGDNVTISYEPTDDEVRSADIVMFFTWKQASEGRDKPFAKPMITDEVTRLSALNPNLVVVASGGSGFAMPWMPKAKAFVYAFLGGQECGNAFANVISGKVCPSGRLPFTIEKNFTDGPGKDYNLLPNGQYEYGGGQKDSMRIFAEFGTIERTYKEGVYVGYRWYEKKGIEPRFPFGFGLSYTTFDFGTPAASMKIITEDRPIMITVPVTNTGSMAGSQVVQLYVHSVDSKMDRPEKELKGFKRVMLQPGETKTVDIPVKWRDLAYWDESTHAWNVDAGDYDIKLGASSADILQTVRISVK